MQLIVLGSSSKGNGYILKADSGESLIVEAGRDYSTAIEALDFQPLSIAGVIATHRHGDHTAYIRDYVNTGNDVLLSSDVIAAYGLSDRANVHEIRQNRYFKLGGFGIQAFKVKHDVPCLGFLIDHKESGRIAFITDTYAMPYELPDVNHWMLEANYSDEILTENILEGRVPQLMRKRLLMSHMSLANAIGILKRHDMRKVRNIVLVHLSDGNSNERDFVEKVRTATGKRVFAAKPNMKINFNLNPF